MHLHHPVKYRAMQLNFCFRTLKTCNELTFVNVSQRGSISHTSPLQIPDKTAQVCYGLATISRLLEIIGLFCRIPSLL